MKIIKFRMWNFSEKKMDYELEEPIYQECGLNALLRMTQESKDYQTKEKNYDLMQFTGLIDKNSKEIYEGDIVRWSEKIYIIKWLEHIAGFIMERTDFELERPDIDFDSVVIGNIYENQDLLK